MDPESRKNTKLYMPNDSYFFEKIIPGLLVTLGIVTLVLILFALGVLFGLVHF